MLATEGELICVLAKNSIFCTSVLHRVKMRLSGVSQVEKPLKTWQPLRFGTVLWNSFHFGIFVDI